MRILRVFKNPHSKNLQELSEDIAFLEKWSGLISISCGVFAGLLCAFLFWSLS